MKEKLAGYKRSTVSKNERLFMIHYLRMASICNQTLCIYTLKIPGRGIRHCKKFGNH